jgi:hypothetical protein
MDTGQSARWQHSRETDTVAMTLEIRKSICLHTFPSNDRGSRKRLSLRLADVNLQPRRVISFLRLIKVIDASVEIRRLAIIMCGRVPTGLTLLAFVFALLGSFPAFGRYADLRESGKVER